jgi:hypothetical protein
MKVGFATKVRYLGCGAGLLQTSRLKNDGLGRYG